MVFVEQPQELFATDDKDDVMRVEEIPAAALQKLQVKKEKVIAWTAGTLAISYCITRRFN